ncbi:hypothetical protein M426DRAFT_234466 [Hypoxylon sp. CI-4A]|nr:hypothetical protein M426DRAFT_234466 [Hypoxylon sp. CI-4A]
MKDIRIAKQTVAAFAEHIDRLRPEDPESLTSAELLNLSLSMPSPTVKRQGSNNSQSSRSRSSRWSKSVGKEWAESASGTLWHHISQTLEDVAAQFQGVNPTALKEFISAREILDLGAEFVRCYNRRGWAAEKPHWAAEDLFFDLQYVKSGDISARRWLRARPERKAEWDIADYITRFVLAADEHRVHVNRADWNAWNTDFETNVTFYLCVLRCFVFRDAKQRAAKDERDRIRAGGLPKHGKEGRKSDGSSTPA